MRYPKEQTKKSIVQIFPDVKLKLLLSYLLNEWSPATQDFFLRKFLFELLKVARSKR